MEPRQTKLNLSGMPPRVRDELLDFYEFLCQKYGKEQNGKPFELKGKAFSNFLANPVIVDKVTRFSREALHDADQTFR